MDKIVDINSQRPHITNPVDCKRCGHQWVAVYPEKTNDIQCPGCYGFVNEYGTQVSRHVCETCKRPFTLCPEVKDDTNWKNCLADDCASYDPSRDIDKNWPDIQIVRDDKPCEGCHRPIKWCDCGPTNDSPTS